jgi:hypothetical protein
MRQFVPIVAMLFLGLAGAVPPALARPVKSGAMDICRVIDGGQVVVVDGTELCCAHEVRGDEETGHGTGPFYCVECDPPGSDNCEESTERPGRPDAIDTLLLRVLFAYSRDIRAEEEKLRDGLADVLSAVQQLETKVEEVEKVCSGDKPPVGTPGRVE